MSPRLKLALIQYQYHTDNGFATVIAVGLGLVMIIVGLTMAARSQSDQVLGTTQKNITRALGAAEVGATRYQYLINQARVIARFPDCINPSNRTAGVACNDPTSTNISDETQVSWANITKYDKFGTCGTGGVTASNIANSSSTSWTDVDPTDISKGQYRLVSYKYTKLVQNESTVTAGTVLGTGTLIVEGRVNVTGTGQTATTGISTSTTQLEVKIPVKKTDPKMVPVPGVWTKSGAITANNQKVNGDILLSDCSVANSTVDTMQANNLLLPSVNQVQKTSASMPSVPTIPTTNITDLGSISKDTTLGSTTKVGNTTYTVSSTTYQGISGVYLYKVTSMSGNITVSIPAGQKVIIFVTGNIDKNVTIDHPCGNTSGCSPSDVIIFGTGTSVTSGTPTMCLNGSNSIDAFIIAPSYAVAVSGGGNAGNVPQNPTVNTPGVINGAVWANQWDGVSGCGSGSNKVVVKQDGNITWDSVAGLGLSPQGLPPTIDTFSSWQKKQVQ